MGDKPLPHAIYDGRFQTGHRSKYKRNYLEEHMRGTLCKLEANKVHLGESPGGPGREKKRCQAEFHHSLRRSVFGPVFRNRKVIRSFRGVFETHVMLPSNTPQLGEASLAHPGSPAVAAPRRVLCPAGCWPSASGRRISPSPFPPCLLSRSSAVTGPERLH